VRWICIALSIAITGSACGREQNATEKLTPLEAAVVADLSPDKVKALLEGGADPNQRSPRGYAVLIHASDALLIPGEREHLSAEDFRKADEIVSLLIKHGANPNLQPENGYSALAAAIAANRPVAARLLLNARADPNGGGSGNFTPLMLAAHHCRPEIARDLLQYGADPAQRDTSGAVAADLAKRAGCRSVVDVIGAAAAVSITVSGVAPAVGRSEYEREWARMSAAHDRLVSSRPRLGATTSVG
jgi:ankyrin repeat protein